MHNKKDKKEILPDKWPAQGRTENIGTPPKGMWYDPKVKEGKGTEQNKPHVPSLNDAVKYYIYHPEKFGTPGSFDMQKQLVEFNNGKVMTFDDIVKNYMNDSGEYKESGGGFFDGPVDIGKEPKGDFPSVQWMPRGQEDADVDPNYVSASKKKAITAIPINKDVLQNALHEVIKTKAWNEWYEDYAKDYEQGVEDDAREHGKTKLPPSFYETVFEDWSIEDWIENYGDAEISSWLQILEGYTQESELLEDYPEVYKAYKQELYNFYHKVSKKKAFNDPLTLEQKEQIAAKYGTEYNSAVVHFNDALTNGHPAEKALEYAEAEMEKVDIHISKDTLSEVANIYLPKA